MGADGVGASVGELGATVGLSVVGASDGSHVGLLGSVLGCPLGDTVGLAVGLSDGLPLGYTEGPYDGSHDGGPGVGLTVGASVGNADGHTVGAILGIDDGTTTPSSNPLLLDGLIDGYEYGIMVGGLSEDGVLGDTVGGTVVLGEAVGFSEGFNVTETSDGVAVIGIKDGTHNGLELTIEFQLVSTRVAYSVSMLKQHLLTVIQ